MAPRYLWSALFVLLLVAALHAKAAPLEVELRGWDVWTVQDGGAKQLTADDKPKAHAIISPPGDRVAYEECPWAADQPCSAKVVIVNTDGQRLISSEPCARTGALSWIGSNALGLECPINPSLAEYYEINATTGETTLHLYGYGFRRSPDGQKIAHAGGVVHLAPPWGRSNYLQVDHMTIYPLPYGQAPFEQDFSPDAPQGVSQTPLNPAGQVTTHSGIHDFLRGLAWAVDSQRVAVIDCVYNWSAENADALAAGYGQASERQCSIVVVAMDGSVASVPLGGFSYSELGDAHLIWDTPRKITLDLGTPGHAFSFDIP
jgi:hypothetical protein